MNWFWIAVCAYSGIGAVSFLDAMVRAYRRVRGGTIFVYNRVRLGDVEVHSESKWPVVLGLVFGVLFTALGKYGLFWPVGVVQRIRKRQQGKVSARDLPQTARSCFYTVRPGDNLSQLLRASGCTAEQLRDLNRGGFVWAPGSRVVLPRALCLYLTKQEQSLSLN